MEVDEARWGRNFMAFVFQEELMLMLIVYSRHQLLRIPSYKNKGTK